MDVLWYVCCSSFNKDSSGLTMPGIAFRMATKLGLQLDCSSVVAIGGMSEEAI